ncbi:Zn-dependent alcohol dehydrogenase [Xylogone sp. PMI_703]|nr:Zn-dependent alcohol dehydrogenase [Xylogone sp. PMI_703]
MATAIPQTQLAGWVNASGPSAQVILRKDVPVQQPVEGEVLIKLECTGVCYSDVARIFGEKPLLTNIAGHEGVGRVIKVGNDVSESLIGQRVGVGWIHNVCGVCEICEEDYTACPKQDNSGRSVPGTFQQYVIAKEKFVVHIPQTLSSESAAPLLCAGITMFSAIGKANLKPGQWVVILGAGGGLGHLGIQICKRRGYNVIAVDSGSEKRELCMRLGASKFLDFKEKDVEAGVKALTGGYGSHAVICTAGSINAYEQAFKLVRNLGTLICIGLTTSTLPVSPFEVAVRGLRVIGSSVGRLSEMTELMNMAVAGDVAPDIEVFEFDKLDEIVHKLAKNQFSGRVVVRIPQ